MQTTQKPEENELEVIFPDREVRIGDETIEVKEFTFFEGLKAEPIVEQMIPDLRAVFDNFEDDDVEYQRLVACFGKHAEAFVQLMSLSTGKSVEWIGALNDLDGQVLSMTFWRVNASFFTRRVVTSAMSARIREEAKAPTGEKSSAH